MIISMIILMIILIFTLTFIRIFLFFFAYPFRLDQRMLLGKLLLQLRAGIFFPHFHGDRTRANHYERER